MPEVTGTVSKGETEKVESSDSVTAPINGATENGVSSTSPEKVLPEKNECEVLLAQGKRHLLVKDYPNAVATLGDACAKLTEMHGDLADELADAYFSYGRALLELAREESNVLGTDPEKDGSEDGDEEEDGEEEEGKKENEDGEEESKKENEDGEAEAKVNDDNKEDNSNSNTKEEKESSADETIDTTKEVNEEEGGEDKDDVDNLQLAWEVFELAKKIYERQEADAKLAETYLYLGEVGLESENYSGAIEDMKRCVEIQQQILPPDHRDIAETYFQLGVACSLCNEFDQAIVNFKTSSDILETRIKNLEKNGAPDTDAGKSPFYSVENEISEIKALLPEIKTKIADMEDFKQETIKSMMASLKEQPQNADGAGSSSSSFASSSASAASSSAPVANGSMPKPAMDISHLVRKKRKPEEDISGESSVKKSCSNEVGK